jgi:hypothetical protein
MIFRNLTPHPVVIHTTHGEITLAPDGPSPHLIDQRTAAGTLDIAGHPVPLWSAHPTRVANLPKPEPGTGLIVASLIAIAQPDRTDLYVPADLIRDPAGQPIACRGLTHIRPP